MIEESSTFIIAEAGVNHHGDLDIAKEMVDRAFEAGADAIKFQTFKAENLVSKSRDERQYKLLKELELSYINHQTLYGHCKNVGIHFLSSPFDDVTADFLDELDVGMFKIASGELNNLPLLEHIAKKNKPILLSTGMSHLSEVEQALHAIQRHNDKLIVLLHCVSNYPAAPEDVNLRAMETMELAFHLPVGYSDHTLGIEVPIAAVSLGATVIEKHFTLDSSLKGADHALSLDPDMFAKMVMAIRNVEVALGDGLKKPAPKELAVRESARKSLVAKIDIPEGTVLTVDMVTSKRPGKGIPPTHLELLLGKTLLKDVQIDEPLHWDMFVN